ncbi:MAG TPA: hypothetical protein VMF52_00465 [Steroidobacteraceae bacterium]|nr:hypothetical protein [Steroidobacteraceae bacterium]
MIARATIGLFAWLALTALPSGAAGIPTYSAHDFIDSVGVNTHLRHKRSVYDTQFAALKQKLLDAHIGHIRDGAMDKDGGFHDADASARFAELGRAGIRATFVFRPMAPREFVQGWPARVAPSFEAYELPNEMNQVKNLPWAETLRVYMPMFRQYVREGRGGSDYPIVGPSLADVGGNPFAMLGDRSADIDFGNVHKYYRAWNPGVEGYGGKAGDPPCEKYRYGALAYALCRAAIVSGDKPVIVTEAGYATGGKPGFFVPPEVQSKYLARLLLLHFAAGVKRTFVYQLADHGSDTGGSMGLIDQQGGEKPAFRELKALMRELFDERDAKPAPLDAALDGDVDDVKALSFGKSDGSYRIVLWLEKAGYDVKTSQPIEVRPQDVRVALGDGFSIRRVVGFADDGGTRERKPAGASLAVTDNLTVLDVGRAR